MIGAVSASSLPSAGAASNSAKEAALQSQIDTTDAKANTCGCSDTAAKLKKDVAKLKAQLDALKATDKASGPNAASASDAYAKGNGEPDKLAGPEATARQAEFDGTSDDDDAHATQTNVIWA